MRIMASAEAHGCRLRRARWFSRERTLAHGSSGSNPEDRELYSLHVYRRADGDVYRKSTVPTFRLNTFAQVSERAYSS